MAMLGTSPNITLAGGLDLETNSSHNNMLKVMSISSSYRLKFKYGVLRPVLGRDSQRFLSKNSYLSTFVVIFMLYLSMNSYLRIFVNPGPGHIGGHIDTDHKHCHLWETNPHKDKTCHYVIKYPNG